MISKTMAMRMKQKNMAFAVILALFFGGLGVFYVSARNGIILALTQAVTCVLFLGGAYWAEQSGEIMGWLLAVFFITLFIAVWVIAVICNVVGIQQYNSCLLANNNAKEVF